MGKFLDKVFGSNSPKRYYGGSKEAYQAFQERYASGEDRGTSMMNAGVDDASRASYTADKRYGIVANQNQGLIGQFDSVGDKAGRQMTRTLGDYNASRADYEAGRGGILGNARAMERSAANMPSQYQRTAEREFALNQQANTRAAVSAATSGGGALAMRNALAAAASGNANAAAQAEITRANEYNQLIGMQNAARAQAAGIRTGVAGMDQASAAQAGSMAQYMGNRQLAAYGAQGGILGQQADLIRNQAGINLAAAGMKTNAGLATQGQYLDAQTAMESAQLGVPEPQKKNRLSQGISLMFDAGNLRGSEGGSINF